MPMTTLIRTTQIALLLVTALLFSGLADTLPDTYRGGLISAAVILLVLLLGLYRAQQRPAPVSGADVEPSQDESLHALAEGLAQWRERLAPLDEATLGYRAQLESNGWSPAAAEQMAVSFYATQIHMLNHAIDQGHGQDSE